MTQEEDDNDKKPEIAGTHGDMASKASTSPLGARSAPRRRRPQRRHLRRRLDPDPGRAGGGAQAPGHVHRRHVRRHRPASPRVRGGRQLDRRVARGLLRRHRRHHPHRQLDLGDRQRPRHPDRREDGRQARAEALGRRDRPDRAARRRQVQPEQLQGLGRPARRRRELRQRPVEVAAPDRPPRRPGALDGVPPGRAPGPADRGAQRRPRLADEDHRRDREARHRGPLPARPRDLLEHRLPLRHPVASACAS